METEVITAALNFFTALFQAAIEIVALVTTSTCSCIGIFIAAGAAVFAARSAQETRQNTQAQVANSLLDAYATPEMRGSVLEVLKFAHGHGLDFAEDYRNDRYHAGYNRDLLEPARRQLSHHYKKAAILAQHGLIDRKLLKSVISKDQVGVAVTYVEPLDVVLAEKVTHSEDPRWTYSILRELHPPPYEGFPDPPPPELPASPF
jgi:hypothetical protein